MSAPPLIYVESPDDTFEYQSDWKEVIGDTAPVSSSFKAESQDTTLTGYIPANKTRSALRYFLGYSYADDTAPYALHRELPARHPKYPQLYAYDASVTELGPLPNPLNPNNETYIESPFLGTDDQPMYYGGYSLALLTVKFKSWGRIRFLPDSDIGSYLDEYKRYTSFDTEPSMESLQAEGTSQLTFKEGTASDPKDKPFPAPIAELMGKTALTVSLYHWPHNALSTDPDILLLDRYLGKYSTGDTPSNYATWKFPPRLGTVNKDFFLGFYPGTLLLRAVKATPMLFPVTCADPYELATGWNLQVVMEHFDPPKGVTYSVDASNPTGNPVNTSYSPYRGHRLFPWRKDGLWYYATRETTGKEMLPLTDFWGIFKNVNDPS